MLAFLFVRFLATAASLATFPRLAVPLREVMASLPPRFRLRVVAAAFALRVLFAAYDNNSVAADAKYEDKIVKVSGYIQSIGKDITDTAYLVIGGKGFLDGVQCMLPEGQEGLVGSVSKGQYVTLKGKVSGQVVGNVLVRNCTFSN